MNPLPHEPPLGKLSSQARDFLATAKFPQGHFDPEGIWKQSYALWLTILPHESGALVLEKNPNQDGTFDMHVNWKVQQSTKGFQHLQATINCSANPLATPRSWQASSNILTPAGLTIDELTDQEDVKVKDGVFEFSDGQRRFADAPLKAWTSNWSLMAALPRLGGREIEPLTFTLLDYLDERKDEQVLSYVGTQEINLGGRTTKLSGYQLLGRGNLPMEYWLDEQKRLVLLLGRERCLVATQGEPTV